MVVVVVVVVVVGGAITYLVVVQCGFSKYWTEEWKHQILGIKENEKNLNCQKKNGKDQILGRKMANVGFICIFYQLISINIVL